MAGRRLLMAALALALAIASPAAAADRARPAPWDATLEELAGLDTRLLAELRAIRSTLTERIRQAERNDLGRRLSRPPRRWKPGYAVLPRIREEAPVPARPLHEKRYSLPALRRELGAALDATRQLAAEVRAPGRASLDAWVDELLRLEPRHQSLREHLRYHRLWQPAIARHRSWYQGQNRLVELARELDTLLSGEAESARIEALRTGILEAVAPFRPTPSLRLVRGEDAWQVMHVEILTDIQDNAFLSRFERAVAESFDSAAARAAKLRIALRLRRVSPETLYAGSPPASGSPIDSEAHRARFPAGALVLTTGAASTHAHVGEAIELGPEDISARELAHEFAHLLGFSDAYLRGFEGSPDSPEGVVIVEWVGLRDDLMGNPRGGAVSAPMVAELLRGYGPARRSLQAAHAEAR